MPLFLAPILWITSAGAVAAGSTMGYRAKAVWADAVRIQDGADAELTKAQEGSCRPKYLLEPTAYRSSIIVIGDVYPP